MAEAVIMILVGMAAVAYVIVGVWTFALFYMSESGVTARSLPIGKTLLCLLMGAIWPLVLIAVGCYAIFFIRVD